jgi:hypothetical protein
MLDLQTHPKGEITSLHLAIYPTIVIVPSSVVEVIEK